MEIIIIKSSNNVSQTDLTYQLIKRYSKDKKVAVISLDTKNHSLEQKLNVDDLLSLDIRDYLLKRVTLEKVMYDVEDFKFIRSPISDDTTLINKENIENLLVDLNTFDYIFIYKPSFQMDANIIHIITNGEKPDQNAFFIFYNKNSDFDERLDDTILLNKSKYLGYYDDITQNFDEIFRRFELKEAKSVAKVGFFEKLKMKLKK